MLISFLTPFLAYFAPSHLWPLIAPTLFAPDSKISNLLSKDVTDKIESLRAKYDVQGIGLAVSSRNENLTEAISFGVANTKGESVTNEVRDCSLLYSVGLGAELRTIVRPSSQ